MTKATMHMHSIEILRKPTKNFISATVNSCCLEAPELKAITVVKPKKKISST